MDYIYEIIYYTTWYHCPFSFGITDVHPSNQHRDGRDAFAARNGLQITWAEGLAKVGLDWSLVAGGLNQAMEHSKWTVYGFGAIDLQVGDYSFYGISCNVKIVEHSKFKVYG